MIKARHLLAICILLLILLPGCRGIEYKDVTYEGENDTWRLEMTVEEPYRENPDEPYFPVIFTCLSGEIPYDEYGMTSFALGTGVGNQGFTFNKESGYIPYDGDPFTGDRIQYDGDKTFTVYFDRVLLDFNLNPNTGGPSWGFLIYAGAAPESIINVAPRQ